MSDYRAGLQGSGCFQLWPDETSCQNPSADFTGADSQSELSEDGTLWTPLRSERPSATGNLRVFLDEPPWTMSPPAEDLSAVLSSICANSESAVKGEFLCALMLSDY